MSTKHADREKSMGIYKELSCQTRMNHFQLFPLTVYINYKKKRMRICSIFLYCYTPETKINRKHQCHTFMRIKSIKKLKCDQLPKHTYTQ